jgi:2-oxoglutarate dehydrogenase E2 component (dihydrolipoamide succinyltransferase)
MSEKLDIVVPAAGESVTEAEVGVILTPTGSHVAEDEPILELETDKASMPLNAPTGGVVEVLVEEGATVQVGDIVARLTVGVAAGPVEEKPAEQATVAVKVAAKKEEVVEPAPARAEPTAAKSSEALPATGSAAVGKSGPAVKAAMAQAGLTPQQLQGTGRGGRILKADVIAAIKNPAPAFAPSLPAPPTPNLGYGVSLPQAIEGDRETRKRMSRLRRVVAKRLVEAQHNAAMLTTFNEIDMSYVMRLRKQYKERFKETHGIGLGFMSFFTKAVVEALKACPDINAYIDDEDIVYRNYYDVSVAVSTPKGLVVPVVRDCDQLSFAGVEAAIVDYAIRGRDGKLSADDMQGGGFTITNGGVFGSLISTPILNPPQSAILGMHKIEERPVVVNGEIVIRPMMYVALSYDHRIVDGKEAVTFLVKIKECIEDPAKIMLEL